MQRDYLLLVTALIEVGTGLSLMILPFIPFALLLDVSQPGRETIFIGRVAGAALFSIGSNCWLARGEQPGRALRGLLISVLIYDVLAAGFARLRRTGLGHGRHRALAGGRCPWRTCRLVWDVSLGADMAGGGDRK